MVRWRSNAIHSIKIKWMKNLSHCNLYIFPKDTFLQFSLLKSTHLVDSFAGYFEGMRQNHKYILIMKLFFLFLFFFKLLHKHVGLVNFLFSTFKKKMVRNGLVHVYFKDLGVTKYSKDQLFGWVDILGKG